MNAKSATALVLGCIAIIIAGWLLFVWEGRTSDFTTPASTSTIQNMFAKKGLETCKESGLTLHSTPGFVAGKTITVSTDCSADPNPMRVAILQFESEEARNAAQQRAASVHRSGFGPHFAYSYGPYLITLQGTRAIGDQLLLGKILTEAGARP